MNPPVFITGFMGSGKTTFGRALAKELGYQFIDLDLYIEARFRRTVAQLFAEKGETEFRRIERAMLHEVGEMADVVVSCGGGTPCFFDNAEYMNSAGTTVYLRASRERLIDRLARSRGRRPLIAGLTREDLGNYIDRALNDRAAHYNKARISFESDLLEDASQISRTVARFIALHGREAGICREQ